LDAISPAGGANKLYAGLSPALARAFPANAAQWLVFELCVKYIGRWTHDAPPHPHKLEAQAAAH
jgi:hypothetical protein